MSFNSMNIIFVGNLFNGYHFLVQSLCRNHCFSSQHISDTAAHAGCKVLARLAEHDDTATGHILTSVVSDALHNCGSSGVAHAETLTCDAVDKCLAAGCSVKRHITDDDILLLPYTSRPAGGYTTSLPPDKSFSEVVVAVADQLQRQSLRDKCAKALSAGYRCI